jgi:hypothetical protein
MIKMDQRQPGLQPASDTERPRKIYVAPTLTLFGQVAALTQAVSCSANNDGANACAPGSVGTMGKASDRRLKQDIVRIGEHPAGFGLYLYRYKTAYQAALGHGRQFGVLADEIAAVFPEAVVTDSSGFMAVRYDVLGITPALH